jgi:hypothetical protein
MLPSLWQFLTSCDLHASEITGASEIACAGFANFTNVVIFVESSFIRKREGAANEGYPLSQHAQPLRSVHANRTSGARRQIKRNSTGKWPAVINHNRDGAPVLRVRNR